MDQSTARKRKKARRAARRRVLNTGVGKELVRQQASMGVLHRFSTERFDMSGAFSDGTAVIKVDIGPYTYQMFMLTLVSDAEIAGKTTLVNGRHIVNTANISDYLENVELRIDGRRRRNQSVEDLLAVSAYRDLDVMEGHLIIPFGGPNLFDDPDMEDLYMLGTKNLRDLRIHVDFTPDWDSTSMHLVATAEYAPVERNVSHFEGIEEYRYSFDSGGDHTITDLPTHSDISHILVFADGMGDVELKVDNLIMAEGNVYDLNAVNALHGRDIAALGNHFMWDAWRGGEAKKGLAGLRTAAQSRRNAKLRLKLNLAGPAEVRVVVGQCGPLAQQD